MMKRLRFHTKYAVSLAYITLVGMLANPIQGRITADLSDILIFPADNPWHYDISQFPVHPNSANYVNSVGMNTALHPDFGKPDEYGIPYLLVDKNQNKIVINYTDYGDESDPGPFPIPLNAPVEGNDPLAGDRHTLVIDKDAKILYELYIAIPKQDHWDAACGAKYDLTSNNLRPDGWTSADAAGLPILPGLVRYDEIAHGEINHAIRMTVQNSQRKYLWPARHYASSSTNANLSPMGLRFRLKASVDISSLPRAAKIVATALKKYGMIVADNGGDWFISGASDERMPDDEINALKTLKGKDFEAVLSVDAAGNPIQPSMAIRAYGNSREKKSVRGRGQEIFVSGENESYIIWDKNGFEARWFNLLGKTLSK